MEILFNIGLSSIIISTALWIAKNNPVLGGFVVSLPLSTLIVLFLNRLQSSDAESGTALAKSIFVAIPSTLTFFIPFLLADRFKLSFWTCYLSGIFLLVGSYFIHKYVVLHWIR